MNVTGIVSDTVDYATLYSCAIKISVPERKLSLKFNVDFRPPLPAVSSNIGSKLLRQNPPGLLR